MQDKQDKQEITEEELLEMKSRMMVALKEYNDDIKQVDRINRNVLSGINNCFRVIKNIDETLNPIPPIPPSVIE